MTSTQVNVSAFASSSLLNSDASNMSQKYGGLLHRTVYKKVRANMVQLFNYIYTISPEFRLMHSVVSFFRILQLYGPSLMEGDKMWQIDQVSKWTSSILSIFYHLIPEFARDSGAILFCYVYVSITLLFFLLLFGSSQYFASTAKLSPALSTFFALYMGTFHYLSHPIVLYFVFEIISKVLFVDGYSYNLVQLIVSVCLVIVCFLISTWLFITVASQNMQFRPLSLMSVMISPHNITYISVNAIGILLGFATCSPKYVQIALQLVSAVVSCVTGLVPYYCGGFINTVEGTAISAACFSAVIIDIIIVVFKFINFETILPLFFIFFILFILLIIVFRIFNNMIVSRFICALDKIHDDESNYHKLKSVSYFINLACAGMNIAHPICISWDFFKVGVEKWREDSLVWFIFAKFSCLYPEDSTTLSWIYHSLLASKIKGATGRTIKEQSLTISRLREANLSPNLKMKLNNLTKSTVSSKHKLRRVWDLAIQGNIGEMESSIKRFDREQSKNDAELKHLLTSFPNNRFVTRAYARFCKELKANHKEYSEYLEKSRQLQRGVLVNEDLFHKLGIYAFPNLPPKKNVKFEQQTMSGDLNQSSFDITENEEDNTPETEINSITLRETIEKVQIPAILWTKVSRIAMLIILFVIPMIAFFVYSSIFIANLTDPLAYLRDIALLSTKAMMLTAFHTQYFYEKLGIYPPTLNQSNPPELFGGTYITKDMLEFIIGAVTTNTQDMYDFNAYSNSNSHVLKAKSYVFSTTVEYCTFKSVTEKFCSNMTVQSCLMDEITQSSYLLGVGNVTANLVNTSYMLNIIQNNYVIDNSFDNTLSELIQFLTDNYNSAKKLSTVVMVVAIVICIVFFIVALVFQVVWIQYNKDEAYHCLTALPKNAVSSLVENLRVLKNEDGNESTTNTDTDVNKQEDNILKLLVTGGDSSNSQIADRIILILGTIITIALECTSIYLFSNLFISESKEIVLLAPHLNYLTASYSQSLAAQYLLHLASLFYEDSPAKPIVFTLEYLEERFLSRIAAFRSYYNLARFGGTTSDQAPFTGFDEALEKANAYIQCKSESELPDDFMEMAGCYSIESIFTLSEVMLLTTYYKQIRTDNFVLTANYSQFVYLWTLTISPIYDGFFGPMFSTIIPTIQEEIDKQKNRVYPILITLLLIVVIFEMVVEVQVHNIEKHIRTVLLLLLHSPQSIIMGTSKIMAVLHGDFSRIKGDMTKRNVEFYDKVFALLPDAVLICDPISYNILTVSKACERILFKSENELVGNNFKDLLASSQFHGDFTPIFRSQTQIVSDLEFTEIDPEGSLIHLDLSTMKINNQLIVTIHDNTFNVRYNTLIQDERKKSDALLASILPPSLVSRVQSGEKNISFSVQSATIVFMDIVSFTPWCGSNEATKVMMTLNQLFKKFDASCAKYPTMTKIKCIGDCYMAAGGIFSEVNNPVEHSREVVSFGVDALDCVRELDQELDEKLQIRVGINTGGPIVAGVLGIGKPTFEILGPAINMAQQMEHHGVPMAVHISRSVYELIYGENFKIKERGAVEVKNGSVITYIIEERT